MSVLLAPPDKRSIFGKEYLHGVWIPTAFIIAGIASIKPTYAPYAAVVGLLVIAWRFSEMRPKPILHKTLFQGFRHVEKKVLSPNTAIYRFALPTNNTILGLPIGQHISVQAEINGEKVMRSYTPISTDENRGFFDLLVKSYPTGRISKHFGELKINDYLKVRGPKGAMVYEPNMVRHFGMIAGGTGITPMLQIIRAIIRKRPRNGGNDKTEVDFIFANVNSDDILLKEDLDTLAKEDPGFRVHYVLNNPPEGWTGGVGFVTPEMIKEKLPAPAKDVKILLCGPPPMINAMKKATESLGYDEAAKVSSKLHDQVFCF